MGDGTRRERPFTRNLKQVSLGVYKFDYRFFGDEDNRGWLNDVTFYITYDLYHQKTSHYISFDEYDYMDYMTFSKFFDYNGEGEAVTNIQNILISENEDVIEDILKNFPSCFEKQRILQNLDKTKGKM